MWRGAGLLLAALVMGGCGAHTYPNRPYYNLGFKHGFDLGEKFGKMEAAFSRLATKPALSEQWKKFEAALDEAERKTDQELAPKLKALMEP